MDLANNYYMIESLT